MTNEAIDTVVDEDTIELDDAVAVEVTAFEVENDITELTIADVAALVDALPASTDPEFGGRLDKVLLLCAGTGAVQCEVLLARITKGTKVKSRTLNARLKELGGGASDGKPAAAEYTVKDGCIYSGDNKLTNFIAKITNEVIRDNSAERQRTYSIVGALADGTVLDTVTVEAEAYQSMEWVSANWGARAWMRQRCWGFVAEAIQLASEPATTIKYTHTGWRTLNGELAYLLPGGAITAAGFRELDVEVPDRLARYKVTPCRHAARAVEHTLRILELGPRHVTVPALLSVYLAPLVEFLGPTFVVWMSGASGSHKSTFASLLLSHFGDFGYNTLPETWQSTANALETTLWRAKDVALVIDNYVPPNSGREALESIAKAKRLIQSYGDGTSRGRLDSNSDEKTPRPPRCMPIVTAEILPPENVSTLGRIFSIPIAPGEIDIDRHDAVKADKHLLREAMASYLAFVAGHPDLAKRALEEHRVGVVDDLPELAGAHPRVVEAITLFLVARDYFLHWVSAATGLSLPTLQPLKRKLDAGLQEAIARQPLFAPANAIDELPADAGRQAPAVEQWLGALRNMLTVGEYELATGNHAGLGKPSSLEPGETWTPKIGWDVGDEVWLLPAATQAAVARKLGDRWQWGDREFAQQLRPFLAVTEGRHAAVKRVVGGASQRVWVLPADLVRGARQRDDENDDLSANDV